MQCEQYLAAEHERSGFPATSLRVGHTIGPMTPLVTREPIFFARLEQGRPIPIPGEGFPFIHLVHVADVASLMASILGNDRAPGQLYNVLGREYASLVACIRLMAEAVGVEPNIVHVPLERARTVTPPLVHWGEALLGGMVFSIDKALRDLDWAPRFGLADGYRDSYEWFAREGRERFEYDFSRDDALLAELT